MVASETRRPADPKAVEAGKRFLSATLGRMGLKADVEVRDHEGDTVLAVVGADAAQVVGKKGATLDALQLLVNRVASKEVEGDRAGLIVDADGYRARREKDLTTMAERLGKKCVTEGKVIVMDPMPPRERRVVHMALARFTGVTTRSEGEGEERRIQIIPMPPPAAPAR
ncbi:MAG: KH domain-containing protein [Myxococcales bacterium]|nr:KH domain-containing protein [Myxococcales bacterium]